jgi:predicted neutral ceramidase superfamily lipid hydrolase
MVLQKQEKGKQRIRYFIAFIVLMVIEVLIALFVHDAFVRPYIGDVLVVMVLYVAARILIPVGFRILPLYVFVFAGIVEFLQYFNLVQVLGIENRFLRVVIGSVFDVKDLLSYGIGCILLGIYEWKIKKD